MTPQAPDHWRRYLSIASCPGSSFPQAQQVINMVLLSWNLHNINDKFQIYNIVQDITGGHHHPSFPWRVGLWPVWDDWTYDAAVQMFFCNADITHASQTSHYIRSWTCTATSSTGVLQDMSLIQKNQIVWLEEHVPICWFTWKVLPHLNCWILDCGLSFTTPFLPRQRCPQLLHLTNCCAVEAAQGFHSNWQESQPLTPAGFSSVPHFPLEGLQN